MTEITPVVTQADRLCAVRINADGWGRQLRNEVEDGDHDDWPAVQEFARHREQAVREERERAAGLLDEAIAQGYPAPDRKVDQCEHGKFGWEDCIACYDIALDKVSTAIRSPNQ